MREAAQGQGPPSAELVAAVQHDHADVMGDQRLDELLRHGRQMALEVRRRSVQEPRGELLVPSRDRALELSWVVRLGAVDAVTRGHLVACPSRGDELGCPGVDREVREQRRRGLGGLQVVVGEQRDRRGHAWVEGGHHGGVGEAGELVLPTKLRRNGRREHDRGLLQAPDQLDADDRTAGALGHRDVGALRTDLLDDAHLISAESSARLHQLEQAPILPQYEMPIHYASSGVLCLPFRGRRRRTCSRIASRSGCGWARCRAAFFRSRVRPRPGTSSTA